MPPQDPPLPSFSLVLSQPQASYTFTPPPYIVFPWAPVTYQPPPVPVVNLSTAPLAPAPQASRTRKVMDALRVWFSFSFFKSISQCVAALLRRTRRTYQGAPIDPVVSQSKPTQCLDKPGVQYPRASRRTRHSLTHSASRYVHNILNILNKNSDATPTFLLYKFGSEWTTPIQEPRRNIATYISPLYYPPAQARQLATLRFRSLQHIILTYLCLVTNLYFCV
ncbi:hypothetical protein C8R47DRAFT_232317 [Mycena vitilis]|nr:hypothetical protein C8R47DRAFT_232317 [Mycena vitilis]